jgi:hypothetical protein
MIVLTDACVFALLGTTCGSGETVRIIRLEAWDGELFLTSRVYHSTVCSQRKEHLSSFHGIFLTEASFSLEGRRFSLNSGCQDVTVPPQIRVWGSFCFLLLSSSFFVCFPSLHSRRPSLCITFSPSLSLYHKTRCDCPNYRRGESEWITRSRSPKHRRGESEWIGLLLMDSPTFSSTSRSACFGDLHASTSAHHDVYTGGSLLSHHASIPSADIHVWFPSQWHPSRHYILHSDTWGLCTLFTSMIIHISSLRDTWYNADYSMYSTFLTKVETLSYVLLKWGCLRCGGG